MTKVRRQDFDLDVPPPLLRSPLFLMVQLLRESARVRDLAVPTDKLRFAHHGVLVCLAERGASSQKEVSTRLRMDASDVVRVIDDLERDHLVQRTRDPNDRRRILLTLTPKGKKVHKDRERVVEEFGDKMMTPLSPRDRKKLEAMLQAMLQHMLEQQQRFLEKKAKNPRPARPPRP